MMEIDNKNPPPLKTNTDYREWIKALGQDDENERLRARKALIREGRPVVPGLIHTLSTGNKYARWEAARILESIRDPAAAWALVEALEDEDHDVRWAAMTGLIALEREGLEPLLLKLMKDFGSVHLREGAHHVLNVLNKLEQLHQPSMEVLQALEGLEPEVAVPRAAERAWENLFGPEVKEKS
jgi:HEAT repeat protein